MIQTTTGHALSPLHIQHEDDGTWLVLSHTGARFARTDTRVNALLIAASPDLLEALRCLLEDTAHASLPIELARSFGGSWDVALAAIAKAECGD